MDFKVEIQVRWSDVDQNQHVRHSAYYDYGAHARVQFFKSQGFGMEAFVQSGIGPILFKEECSFIRELRLNEVVTVNVKIGEILADGSRWEMYHEVFNTKGEKSAQIKVQGAWIDLKQRKVTTPPVTLATAIAKLPKGEDYVYKKKRS